ncbi:hypothetical protein RN001_009501 [Aquatica leii]|uniref:Uncharacterized protein n=1 Tax=Aquatica leii TaxID=1421715 RepID=A0AAN7Q2I3_9COLE|nr:hypothetical protein RN001_009501 [Aquatica leii]
MDGVCEQVQKHVVNFCAYLEPHVEKWHLELQGSETALCALTNQTEQLRHVDKTELDDDDFQQMKNTLKCSIYNGIEEEMVVIRDVIERLNKTNNTLKNKLFTLEKSTMDLYWDDKNLLFNGNATQPPLSKILMYGFEFWQYFNKRYQFISDSFKCLDFKCKNSVATFVLAFEVDLNVKCVRELLALTQYVNNIKAIT